MVPTDTTTKNRNMEKKEERIQFFFFFSVDCLRASGCMSASSLGVCVFVRLFTAPKLHRDYGVEWEFDAWKNFVLFFAGSRLRTRIDDNSVAEGGGGGGAGGSDDYDDDDVQFISTDLIQLVNYEPPQRLYYFSENKQTIRRSV